MSFTKDGVPGGAPVGANMEGQTCTQQGLNKLESLTNFFFLFFFAVLGIEARAFAQSNIPSLLLFFSSLTCPG